MFLKRDNILKLAECFHKTILCYSASVTSDAEGRSHKSFHLGAIVTPPLLAYVHKDSGISESLFCSFSMVFYTAFCLA